MTRIVPYVKRLRKTAQGNDGSKVVKHCPDCAHPLDSCDQGYFCFECGWDEWSSRQKTRTWARLEALVHRIRQGLALWTPRETSVEAPTRSLPYLAEDTKVTFRFAGSRPFFRDRYVSPQAGTVVVRGFFNPLADMEIPGGLRYRIEPARKRRSDRVTYSVIRLPDKTEAFHLCSSPEIERNPAPRLRYTTAWGDQQYVFRQVNPGQLGFELWDGLEKQQLVRRENAPLVPVYTVVVPVPALLVLLFPWLDNQAVAYKDHRSQRA